LLDKTPECQRFLLRRKGDVETDPRASDDLEAGSHRPLPGKYAAAARASRMQTNSMVAIIKVLL